MLAACSFPAFACGQQPGGESNPLSPSSAADRGPESAIGSGQSGGPGAIGGVHRPKLEPETPRLRKAADDLREHVMQMREVLIAYDTSLDASDDARLQRQWSELLTTGHAKHAEMLEAALEEYLADLGNRGQLQAWLYSALEASVENDEFEGTLAIAQALMEERNVNPDLLSFASMSALALNEYDVAREFLERAIEADLAPPFFQQLYRELDTVQAAWEEELEARRRDAEGEPLPRVLMKTTKGNVVIELFENQAPETVGNFIHLVEQGFYENLAFHRVIQHFMAQTGCPHGDGSGDPGYSIYNESGRPDARDFFRGTLGVALAGDDPNSGGSQFFISYMPASHLNGTYTAFGRVIEGMEVVANLNQINPEEKDEDGPPVIPDEIREIEILLKRDHEYVPNKVSGDDQ
jgi:cyclophilin family peptidyl-prolyl cis-trans isomerase